MKKAENLNRPITADKIEAVMKKTPNPQKPWTRWFHRRILQRFMEELTPILHRLFEKIQTDGRLPNSFYEANIIVIPKTDKHITKKETSSQYC